MDSQDELKSEFLYRAHIDVEGFYEVARPLEARGTCVR